MVNEKSLQQTMLQAFLFNNLCNKSILQSNQFHAQSKPS